MAWIELHQNLPGHRKTRRVKTLLEIGTPQAVGHLCLLWLWSLDNAEDGSLGGMLNQEIADVCEYTGDADKFVDALVESGYLIRQGDDLLIHDWGDYCGRLMRKREQNRVRQQNYRDRKKGEKQGAPEEAPPPPPPPPAEVEDKELGKAMSFYMDRVTPMPSGSSLEELKTYVASMGADVCIAAMEYAIDEHKPFWSYIRATLQAYMKQGIRNMSDLQAERQRYEAAKRRQEDTQKHGNSGRNNKKHGVGARLGGNKDGPGASDPLAGFHTPGEYATG